MTRRLVVLDRVAGILLALGLVAAGLLLLDWHLDRVLHLPGTLRTARVEDVVTSGWWPWAAAGGGIVLGLLGVLWLLAHLGRGRENTTRLTTGDETGLLVVDLGSVASAAAARLEALGPLTDVRGTTRRRRGRTQVELHGRVAEHAEAAEVMAASTQCIKEVIAALDGEVACRVLLSSPRGRRSERIDRVRVAEPAGSGTVAG